MINTIAMLAAILFGILALPDALAIAVASADPTPTPRAFVWAALVILLLAVTAGIGILLIAGLARDLVRGRMSRR